MSDLSNRPGVPVGVAGLARSGPRGAIPAKVVAAAVAGNALEFFDFGVYSYFAPFIAKAFFPAENAAAGLLAALAVFGIGFLFRPLGGFIFGRMADRVGRKPAMLVSISMITIGTLAIAVTPTYASIGIAAPIIVVIARLVQGLALGGEVGPTTSYLVEAAPGDKRGIYSSWQLGSQGIGNMLSAILGFVLASVLAPADLATWGWRLPFVAAVLLIPVAVYMRASMPETLTPLENGVAAVEARISHHIGDICKSILVVIGSTVSVYILIYLSTSFAMATLKLAPTTAYLISISNGLSLLGGSLLGGWLSDRIGRKPVMFIPRLLLLVGIYPLMVWVFASPDATKLYLSCGLMSVLLGMTGAASLAAIPEIFPAHARALGLSIAYAVGVAIFGGSTQFVVQWLISTFNNNPLMMAWYSMAASVLCLIGIAMMPETRWRQLEG